MNDVTTKVHENIPKKRKHVDLNDVFYYLKHNIYPGNVCTKDEKSNFRRQSKAFYVENGQLLYKRTQARVITNTAEQIQIIKFIHSGSDSSVEASALAAHRGRDATQRLLKQRLVVFNV